MGLWQPSNPASLYARESLPPDLAITPPRAVNQHRVVGDQRTVHCYGVTRHFSGLLRRTAVRLYVIVVIQNYCVSLKHRGKSNFTVFALFAVHFVLMLDPSVRLIELVH